MGKGPLVGLKVLEFAGIGPGPFCGMLLSDLGADVLRIERPNSASPNQYEITSRGRRSIALDLKSAEGIETCLLLTEQAELVFEGYRPGVMERLGLSPEVVLKRNPRLVYGRMTGWGQTGPYAKAAGHDLNYIAITGALAAIGPAERPVPPLNLIGDFGGGALYLAYGMLAALLHARSTGQGQVIDCAMSDGAASLMAMFYGMRAAGEWSCERASNFLDGGAPFYDTYRCSDGDWVSVGAIEPAFYALLLEKAALSPSAWEPQMDPAHWPTRREALAKVFASKSRNEWCAIMEATDVCFAPVLSMDEAPSHPHNRARSTFVEVDGVVQPAPAPRFSLTPGEIQPRTPREAGADVLADWTSAGLVPQPS